MTDDLQIRGAPEAGRADLGQKLEQETRALIGGMDRRLAAIFLGWQFFKSPDVFRQMAHLVGDSDVALSRRLEHLSNEEGCGAAIIYALGEVQHFSNRPSQLARHAADEVKHQQAYAAMASRLSSIRALPAPELKSTDVRDDLNLDVDLEQEELLASVHIGEVRNLMNMDLIIPALLASDDEERRQFGREMLGIRADEIAHIKYLSAVVTDWLNSGIMDAAVPASLAAEYDQYWWEDLRRAATHLADEVRMGLAPTVGERV
jgi:hypothetical protein